MNDCPSCGKPMKLRSVPIGQRVAKVYVCLRPLCKNYMKVKR